MKTKEKTSKTDATHSLNSFWNIFGLGLKHFKWFVYLGNTQIFCVFFPLIKISCGKCAMETLPSNLLLLSETADVTFYYFTEKILDNAKDYIQSYTIYKW